VTKLQKASIVFKYLSRRQLKNSVELNGTVLYMSIDGELCVKAKKRKHWRRKVLPSNGQYERLC